MPVISHKATQSQAKRFFEHLKYVAENLQRLAQKHIDGEELAEADIAWVNGMVSETTEDHVCVQVTVHSGWFYNLYWPEDKKAVDERDRIATSIHTQPGDAQGNIVGKVLHIGTGQLNQVLVVSDSCENQVLHVGITQAAQRLVTEDFLRLTDEEWVDGELAKSTRIVTHNVVSSSGNGRLWSSKCKSNHAADVLPNDDPESPFYSASGSTQLSIVALLVGIVFKM